MADIVDYVKADPEHIKQLALLASKYDTEFPSTKEVMGKTYQ